LSLDGGVELFHPDKKREGTASVKRGGRKFQEGSRSYKVISKRWGRAQQERESLPF
jgi:hypothetical protein